MLFLSFRWFPIRENIFFFLRWKKCCFFSSDDSLLENSKTSEAPLHKTTPDNHIHALVALETAKILLESLPDMDFIHLAFLLKNIASNAPYLDLPSSDEDR